MEQSGWAVVALAGTAFAAVAFAAWRIAVMFRQERETAREALESWPDE